MHAFPYAFIRIESKGVLQENFTKFLDINGGELEYRGNKNQSGDAKVFGAEIYKSNAPVV